MGSTGSRLGSRPPRPRRTKRTLISIIVCGGSTSHASAEIEDDPAELVVNSDQHRDPVIDKFQRPIKESGFASGTESGFSSPKIEHFASIESEIEATDDSSFGDSSGSVETNNHGKGLSRSKEIIPRHRLSIGCRSKDIASTSYEDRLPPEPVSANGRANLDVASGIDHIMDRDVSQVCSRVAQSFIPSLHELGDSCSDGVSIENNASEVISVHDSDSGSVSIVSDSTVNFDLQRYDNPQDATPSGPGFVVSDREQGQRDESALHLDAVSISSNILSSSNVDNSNGDARRNSQRLFWDDFSRRNSRRHSDSRTFVFASDDSDDLGSHDRWLLDFNGDFFDDGVGGDTGFRGSRAHSLNEHRWQSRSEIWERLRGGRDGSDRRTTICPSGLHPSGTCACESIVNADGSGAHVSISRIVMLAEALFEVLDEIHRQPVSLSPSMVSLPAPGSVVDSLPVKNHGEKPKTGDNNEQCYICLAEYGEGEKIRVLPCHHEYHMSCIDKWLKEIHGVCPLCRGDVGEGFTDACVSNPEITSL